MNMPIRHALRVALYTFIAVFSVSLLGFIQDVASWAGSVDKTFPSINPLGKAAVAALCAAGSGFVGWLVNYVEDKKNSAGILGVKKPAREGDVVRYQNEAGTTGGTVILGENTASSGNAGTAWSMAFTAPQLTREELVEELEANRKKTVDAIAARVKRGLESKASAKKNT